MGLTQNNPIRTHFCYAILVVQSGRGILSDLQLYGYFRVLTFRDYHASVDHTRNICLRGHALRVPCLRPVAEPLS